MNFLNPLLPQIQETAWESLLLGKAIWGKQGCILCLLINTNLPTQAQNFAGENDQKIIKKKRVGRRDERAEQLPGNSSHSLQEWLTIATRNSSFCSPAVHPQLMPAAQTDHPGEHEWTAGWEQETSLHQSITIGRPAIPFLSSPASSPRTQTCPFGPGQQEQWL